MNKLEQAIETANNILGIFCTEEDFKDVDEALKRVKVVRKGKRLIKWKTDKPGFKVQMINGRPKEVKIKSAERIKRKKGAKIGSKKSKSKRNISAIKRKRSLKLRAK